MNGDGRDIIFSLNPLITGFTNASNILLKHDRFDTTNLS